LARKKIRVGGGEEEERASVTLRFSDRREGDAGEEGRQILERWRPTGRGKALRQRRRRRLRWRLRWRLTSLGHSRLFRSLLFFPFSRASFSAFFLVSREHHCETERALCFGEKVFGGEARATNTTTLCPSLTKDKKTHPPPPLSLCLSLPTKNLPTSGRAVALWLAQLGIQWRSAAASRMPTATGDIREIVGQPVFVPLYRLFLTYGKVRRREFFVVVVFRLVAPDSGAAISCARGA